uniref:Uncharacterized protein n=1 Tax=Setaria italica TaxID=4555 RepID=K4AHA5_SETIT
MLAHRGRLLPDRLRTSADPFSSPFTSTIDFFPERADLKNLLSSSCGSGREGKRKQMKDRGSRRPPRSGIIAAATRVADRNPILFFLF